MGKSPRSWFGVVRKRFLRSSPHHDHHQETTIIVLHTNNATSSRFNELITPGESAAHNTITEATESEIVGNKQQEYYFSKEDIAAIKIQAFFRAHIARRAYRALKGLVKLQAVVRGVSVRRQARIALHCMNALARLQITVRARQLLGAGC